VLTSKDLQMFESVARGQPRLREYLLEQLARKHQELVMTADGEQLRRTQGYALCLQNLVESLDAALAPRKGPSVSPPQGAF